MNASVCPAVLPSICLSRNLLLNLTSPHGKGMQKRVRPSVHPSVRHTVSNISTEHGDFTMTCHQLRILVLFCLFSTRLRVYVFKGRKVPKHADSRFLFLVYFVSLRLTFNLRPSLEVEEYCKGRFSQLL